MKILLTVLALALSSITAMADVTGKWVGTGEWTFNGQGTDCPDMRIAFEESPAEFKRLGGTFDCGVVVLHSDPLSWERRGNELFLEGKAAGTVSPEGFYTSEPVDDEGTIANTKFTRDGNHGLYEERWVLADGQEIYLIQAEFVYRDR